MGGMGDVATKLRYFGARGQERIEGKADELVKRLERRRIRMLE